jgi:proteasome lid subunit RPN8/RPN11
MLAIDKKLEDVIRSHGEADYPYECCGLLLGNQNGTLKTVRETYPISNAREDSAKRNRFLIEPDELMRGESYARKRKLDVVGFYHSHPDHPAAPSQFDLDHAWPSYSYVIVSVHQGHSQDFTSWELESDRSRFNPEDLTTG